jgi:hypothetical protein
VIRPCDDEQSVGFTCDIDIWEYLSDEKYITEEELKAKFNEWLPKQGELQFWDEVSVSLDWDIWYPKSDDCIRFTFVSKVKDKYLVCKKEKDIVDKFEKELFVDWIRFYKYCIEYKPKTELTLAEVESRLGLDAWSLIIK